MMDISTPIRHANFILFQTLQTLAQADIAHAVVRGGATAEFAKRLRTLTPEQVQRLSNATILLATPRREVMDAKRLQSALYLPRILMTHGTQG